MVRANFTPDFEAWRNEARRLLTNGITPHQVDWGDQPALLLELGDEGLPSQPSSAPRLKVPPEFLELAQDVASARDKDRWALLYRILYRLQFENPKLLEVVVDNDVHRAILLQKSVRRDIHKMHAFVRFKKATLDGEDIYVAWHRAEHLIVRAAAPFFARRFGDRRWSIFTPDESAHWDLKELSFGPGMTQSEFRVKDDWDEVWKTYYKSIFNPARIKIKAMKLEMSPKYWSSLPEAELIAGLVREAPGRLQKMSESQFKAAEVRRVQNLEELRTQALGCKACPLYQGVTQTVFGVGPKDAKIMIIGEQPGDQEDLSGRPFVGPAGEVLLAAAQAAGLSLNEVYLTNAVKHFKWKRTGKVRLHLKPNGSELHACKPWLEAEIGLVKPRLILALGVTAATTIIGRLPKIAQERGVLRTDLTIAPQVIISWHPSAILRASPTEAQRMNNELIEDLKLALLSVRPD